MQLFTTKFDIFHIIPFNSLSIILPIIFFSFIMIAALCFGLIKNAFGSNGLGSNANQTRSKKSEKPQKSIKIVALGCRGAGKTTFLVVMFHQWLIAGKECFVLKTNDADRNQLVSIYDQLCDPQKEF